MGALFTLKFEGQRFTPAAVEAGILRWQRELQRYGVAAGERVAVLANNSADWVFVAVATLRLGAVLVPLNTRLTPAELQPLVERLRPRLLVHESGGVLPLAHPHHELASADHLGGPRSRRALRRQAHSRDVGSAPEAWLMGRFTLLETNRQRAVRGFAPPLDYAPDGATFEASGGAVPQTKRPREASGGGRRLSARVPQLILFTSGTTGRPKAACLTVQNLLSSAAASAGRLGTTGADTWLCSLPLFHVGALAMLFRALHDGSTFILQRRFDPDETLRALRQDRVTCTSLVAPMLRAVVDRGSPPPSLRIVLTGGGPTPPHLLASARALGWPVLQTYGLTEAASQVCTEVPGEADGGTCGPPLPGTQLRICRADGAEAPAGECGDIHVRGPTVMLGYLEDASSLLEGGWLRTGDLGAVDDRGRLRVNCRRTDLILSGGENVYPAEVELLLQSHPDVVDAAVVPAADERWGQVPVAAVVLRGGTLKAEDLAAWCRQRLAPFKVPKRFLQLSALPRNVLGKVDREALVARYWGNFSASFKR